MCYVTGGNIHVLCYRRCYTCVMLQEVIYMCYVTGGDIHVLSYRR